MNARERYDSLFQFYAQDTGIPWQLMKAQAIAESNLDPDAVSRVGAVGLTQFMPDTWKDLAVRKGWVSATKLYDPRDPEDAIRAQVAYMRWLFKECGTFTLALAAYNWGIGRVRRTFLAPGKKYNPKDVPAETAQYVARIASLYPTL